MADSLAVLVSRDSFPMILRCTGNMLDADIGNVASCNECGEEYRMSRLSSAFDGSGYFETAYHLRCATCDIKREVGS
jgi:hypothetical protein